MPHERSRVPTQVSGADRDLLAVDRERAAPGADLREPLGVEGDPAAGAHHVPLLLEYVERPLPGQVGRDALGLVEHQRGACAAGRRTSTR